MCVFEDRYRDVQTLYVKGYQRDIMLSLGEEVVAFSPAWSYWSSLIVVDIQPGEYAVLLRSISSYVDPQEIVYTFEISGEVSDDSKEAVVENS